MKDDHRVGQYHQRAGDQDIITEENHREGEGIQAALAQGIIEEGLRQETDRDHLLTDLATALDPLGEALLVGIIEGGLPQGEGHLHGGDHHLGDIIVGQGQVAGIEGDDCIFN